MTSPQVGDKLDTMAEPTKLHHDEAALAGAKQRHPSARSHVATTHPDGIQGRLSGVDPDAELTDEENLSRVREARRLLARARLARAV